MTTVRSNSTAVVSGATSVVRRLTAEISKTDHCREFTAFSIHKALIHIINRVDPINDLKSSISTNRSHSGKRNSINIFKHFMTTVISKATTVESN